MQAAGVHRHLPRLAREFYVGFSTVHWSMTIAGRATGWLTTESHARIRELILHAMVSYDLLCPVYCLMPDHVHLIWRGISRGSDQLKAASFLRRHLNAHLRPRRLQKQAYDHVLRRDDLERDAFPKVAYYLAENPVRAGLVSRAKEYPFSGCVLPGKPDACIFDPKYWDAFWVLYEGLLRKNGWEG